MRFSDGSEMPSEIIEEIRRVGEQCMEDIGWQDQDVALIDNSRVMHGRRAFRGDRVIYSRFGMIDRCILAR